VNVSISNWHLSSKLLVIAVAMFGFGYAMVPIYRAICEFTGIGIMTERDEDAAAFARNTQVDTSRRVMVEFDANSRGSWQFRPKVPAVSVHPGELVTVVYELVSTETRPTVGQAIPSYAPEGSGKFFRKLECFCFKQQALAPNETREFPVVFVIDPKLPADVGTITLSYTFFEVGGQGVKTVAPAGPAQVGG
jgi:cytochrome c oxidase assembly protein subunit 11